VRESAHVVRPASVHPRRDSRLLHCPPRSLPGPARSGRSVLLPAHAHDRARAFASVLQKSHNRRHRISSDGDRRVRGQAPRACGSRIHPRGRNRSRGHRGAVVPAPDWLRQARAGRRSSHRVQVSATHILARGELRVARTPPPAPLRDGLGHRDRRTHEPHLARRRLQTRERPTQGNDGG
jgi:hypothetical protein